MLNKNLHLCEQSSHVTDNICSRYIYDDVIASVHSASVIYPLYCSVSPLYTINYNQKKKGNKDMELCRMWMTPYFKVNIRVIPHA